MTTPNIDAMAARLDAMRSTPEPVHTDGTPHRSLPEDDRLCDRAAERALAAAEADTWGDAGQDNLEGPTALDYALASTSTVVLYREDVAATMAALREAEADRDRYREDHLGACQTIAGMHKAATYDRQDGLDGPMLGVVEDVEALAEAHAQAVADLDDVLESRAYWRGRAIRAEAALRRDVLGTRRRRFRSLFRWT